MSAMVSGFFGMNLASGIETAVGGLWIRVSVRVRVS